MLILWWVEYLPRLTDDRSGCRLSIGGPHLISPHLGPEAALICTPGSFSGCHLLAVKCNHWRFQPPTRHQLPSTGGYPVDQPPSTAANRCHTIGPLTKALSSRWIGHQTYYHLFLTALAPDFSLHGKPLWRSPRCWD